MQAYCTLWKSCTFLVKATSHAGILLVVKLQSKDTEVQTSGATQGAADGRNRTDGRNRNEPDRITDDTTLPLTDDTPGRES